VLEKLQARGVLRGGWPAVGLVPALHLSVNLMRQSDMLHNLVLAAAVKHAASLVAQTRFKQLLCASSAFAECFTVALTMRHAVKVRSGL
jgi:hypothetical protein